jgi:type VI secretion system protein
MPNPYDRRSFEDLVKASIERYLSRLLNVRRGSVPVDVEYGLLDMSNIAGSFAVGYVSDIQREILVQIDRYEKRLLHPTIQQVVEDRQVITLKFVLTGKIDFSVSSTPVIKELSMFLLIDSAGKVIVEIAHGL